MKGIILAGGLGTKLFPSSVVVNKNLMPVYDKPMIYYPLSTLMSADIRDILIISSPQHLTAFQNLLQDGHEWGVHFSYLPQLEPRGIGEVFAIGEKFIGNEKICLVLGDNLFYGQAFNEKLMAAKSRDIGVTLFAYYVKDPKPYGVVEFDHKNSPTRIVEKPLEPKSNFAVTGLYFYNQEIIEIAKSITPSARNELEISDINNIYLQNKNAYVEILDTGFTWLDMGTHESLFKAANYVEAIESWQGVKIACPEEIAWRKGYINSSELTQLIEKMPLCNYKNYLSRYL